MKHYNMQLVEIVDWGVVFCYDRVSSDFWPHADKSCIAGKVSESKDISPQN